MSIAATLSITPAVIGALLGAVLSSIPILKDFSESRRKTGFRRQVSAAIAKSDIDYVDLQHIAESWRQDRERILEMLRRLHADALSGENQELENSAGRVRSLLDEHQSHEPYAELPENISLQLESIESDTTVTSRQVSQLAASLSILYASNRVKASRQAKLAWVSLIIGVLGFATGIVSWIYH